MAGRLASSSTAFFLCDVQERFRPLIRFFPSVINVAQKMSAASRILGIPLVVTEQYPKVFGNTVSEIDVSHATGVHAKTQFSMLLPAVSEQLEARAIQSVVLYGIEAHVCILQTALDLRSRGIDVHVLADGTSSQHDSDRFMAFERMRQSGVFVSTYESVVFQLLGDSTHKDFKAVSAEVIRPPRVDNGLPCSSNPAAATSS